jgi:beta-aspartyl-peptidase (threonine type)
MNNSEHVLLSGIGALEFAKQQDIEIVNSDYLFTPNRFDQWLTSLKDDSVVLDHTGDSTNEKKFGTVGAVAFDTSGNLAAATSTGGMTNKKFGRVGDTPIIGSGTYANNNTCAISCTGHGEFFIRGVVAYDVSSLMEYKGYTLQQACEEVIMKKQVGLGGEGGLVAVDSKGNHSLVFNSEGMYRGYCNSENEFATSIYKV